MSNNVNQQIKEIVTWCQSNHIDRSRIGAQFVKLNRILMAAETPEIWQPAQQAMHQLLMRLEQELCRDETEAGWLKSESAKVFSILLTIMAEAGQYRHETFRPTSETEMVRRKLIDTDLLPAMGRLRQKAISVAKTYLARPVFRSLGQDIEREIYPLLDSMDPDIAPDRFMPFRVIQIGNLVERLHGFRLRTNEPYLIGNSTDRGLLQEIYARKYLRFGTSGVRGLWGVDFTEARAKQVVQAICDFLKGDNVPPYAGAENLQGKRLVIGYDSRRNAQLVAQWVAEVCIANGFKVDLAYRDTPTPALVYYLTDYLDPDEVAGLINCTASHNPPEWQGIKFNPRLGYPAPTNVTDFIAARINELQLLNEPAQIADIADAEARGILRGFDPIAHYTEWILNSGKGNNRIPLDWDRIREYFHGRLIVVDEMHGAGRGYLPKLLGEIGVRHTVIHSERDPNIPGLDYANPEEPFISPLKEKVRETDAVLGLGIDTDADRFGIVDKGGIYFRPNQILPMLIKYLGVERGFTGRVIATQTGSPLNEVLAGKIPDNSENEPEKGVIPAYVDHAYYKLRKGRRKDRIYSHTFLVPVGIKYIEEQRRTDRAYRFLRHLPEGWRETLLIGGEESSGLTTRGHVTDKDGVWADLLILDMLAYYGTRESDRLESIIEIWKSTTSFDGCWVSYGGFEAEGSNSGRADVDAILEAKEELINFYLDLFPSQGAAKEQTFAGLEVVYAGGIRYDLVELQLRDEKGDDRHFLRIRASGTEPINRIYVESSDPDVAKQLMQAVLDKLENLSVDQVMAAHSEWRLVDVLSQTQPSLKLLKAVRNAIKNKDWSQTNVVLKLKQALPTLEHRNQKVAIAWVEALCNQ